MGDPAQAPQAPADQRRLATGPARACLAGQLLAALAAGWLAWRLGGAVLPAVLVAALTPAVIHGAILGAGFLIAWLAADQPRQPLTVWTGTFLREWPRSMQMVYQRFAWQAGFQVPRPGGRLRRRPVVLIHCYAGNRGLWALAAPWFASRGHRVLVPSFSPANGDIDGHVETLRAAIEQAGRSEDAADPGGPVHLVGHSMGGLIARAYLRRYGWDGIGAVVTLGTPHRGTPQAWLGAGLAAQQMYPGSEWIRRLAGEEPLAPPGQMVAVISRQDNMTASASVQTMPLARQIRLSGLGHMAYVVEPRVVDLVLRVMARVERRWLAQRLEMDPEGWEVVPLPAAPVQAWLPLYANDDGHDDSTVPGGSVLEEGFEPVYAIERLDGHGRAAPGPNGEAPAQEDLAGNDVNGQDAFAQEPLEPEAADPDDADPDDADPAATRPPGDDPDSAGAAPIRLS